MRKSKCPPEAAWRCHEQSGAASGSAAPAPPGEARPQAISAGAPSAMRWGGRERPSEKGRATPTLPLSKNGQIPFGRPFIMDACQTPARDVKSRRKSTPRKTKPFKSKRNCFCLTRMPGPAARRENSWWCLRRLKPTQPAARATPRFHLRRAGLGNGSRLRSQGRMEFVWVRRPSV